MVLKYSTNILEMNIGNKFYLYFDEVSFIFKQRGVFARYVKGGIDLNSLKKL